MLDSTLDLAPPAFPVELLLGGRLSCLVEAPVEELADRVSRAAAHHDLFARLVAFDRERPVTRVLHRSPALEVLLSCWLPGQGIRAHDHGPARAVSAVVFGELVETRYRVEGEVAVPERELVRAAQGTIVARPLAIHAVANRGRRPAVSLHVHVPAARLRTWPVRP